MKDPRDSIIEQLLEAVDHLTDAIDFALEGDPRWRAELVRAREHCISAQGIAAEHTA